MKRKGWKMLKEAGLSGGFLNAMWKNIKTEPIGFFAILC
jgi:hypothetical protein